MVSLASDDIPPGTTFHKGRDSGESDVKGTIFDCPHIGLTGFSPDMSQVSLAPSPTFLVKNERDDNSGHPSVEIQ